MTRGCPPPAPAPAARRWWAVLPPLVLGACQAGNPPPADAAPITFGGWHIASHGGGASRPDSADCVQRLLTGWLPPAESQRLRVVVDAGHPLVTDAQHPPYLEATGHGRLLWLPLADTSRAWVMQDTASGQWRAYSPPAASVRTELRACWGLA